MFYSVQMARSPTLPVVPVALVPAGSDCLAATEEFLLARLVNPHTRSSYARACGAFAHWLQVRGGRIEDARPLDIARYARELAATPRPRVEVGTTPVLAPEDIARLYAGFGTSVVEVRDRALISLMLYGFLRIGAALGIRRGDLALDAPRPTIQVREKGGAQRSLPLHAQSVDDLAGYLSLVRFDEGQHLFVAWRGGGQSRGERPLGREQVYAMVRRRLARAGVTRVAGCHAFRATGITRFLSLGGRIETAAHLAGHASLRTTQLYDHRARDNAGEELACLSFAREKGGP
jgi:integrase